VANPPKAKGTGGETELRRLMHGAFPYLRRTAPTSAWDLEQLGRDGGIVYRFLATRPDRGQWLVTMSLDDFLELVGDKAVDADDDWLFEVKRFKRFAHHTIFEETFA